MHLSFLIPVAIFLHAAVATQPESARSNHFARDIFTVIAADNINKNVIFSPISIQSCVALAYMGAKGKTAEEIRVGLKLGDGDKQQISENFGNLVKKAFGSEPEGPELKMANRIFINNDYELSTKFNELATEHLGAKAEQLDFSDAANSVNRINSWVEGKTNKKIQNLLSSDSVNSDTSSVMVNAVYFKGNWKHKFLKHSTRKADFSINKDKKVPVDMMMKKDNIRYGTLAKLGVSAIEMPFKNSNLSMFIMLPDDIEGLEDLEKKITPEDFMELEQNMRPTDVELYLPKFKIEFDVDLKEPLKKLGMTTMFGNEADFSDLYTSTTPQAISEVKHKAFIEVDETGSEAAAATAVIFFARTAASRDIRNYILFRADHPFVFSIRGAGMTYFAGHVTQF